MPYKNVYTSKIRDIPLFKSGSFKTLKAKLTGLTFVTGILKSNNESAVQSYIYRKADWTADDVRDHCLKHNGIFEQATSREALNLDDVEKDYLKVDEISKELVTDIGMSFLYRTHMQLHNTKGVNAVEIERAHDVVVKEMLQRGMMHHQWDKLDTVYQ